MRLLSLFYLEEELDHWQNRTGARPVLHIGLLKQIWFLKEVALCVYSYLLPRGQNCFWWMICPVKSKLEMESQEEEVLSGLRGSNNTSVKPCNHWLSVYCCSCRFKGDGQYVIKRGHKFIKRHGSTIKVCDLTQVSAPPHWLTTLICSTSSLSKNDLACLDALWHPGALLLHCCPSSPRSRGHTALPPLRWCCSGGGCSPGSPPDQCWPRRGLCTQPLQNCQRPRTTTGKSPSCSMYVSPCVYFLEISTWMKKYFKRQRQSSITGLQRPCQLYAQTRNNFITLWAIREQISVMTLCCLPLE